MRNHADGWPELTYRYIEHYAWEPQHLLLTSGGITQTKGKARIDAVYERLRRQEVPLNYLLNILLRVIPSAIRRECLKPFGIIHSTPGLASLNLRTPQDYNHIQPDIHLESETARVFIEVKVDAPLTLRQIEKYATLHAELDNNDGRVKQASVLFLVKSKMLTLSDVQRSFSHESTCLEIPSLLGESYRNITFGSTSWAKFGQTLNSELERRRNHEGELTEMLTNLIDDFLADLNARGLLQE